jgi:transmembrane sensor
MGGEELSEAHREDFADWLRRSPTHLEEYLRIGALREQLLDPAVFEGVSLEALKLRIGTNLETLAPLEPEAAESPAPRRSFVQRSFVMRYAIVAGVLIAAGLAWLVLSRVPVSYQTAIGEQRSVVLADGSIAQLNTRTRIEMHFDATAREVTLAEGEALFKVAKDPMRPFRVRSGTTSVQVIGTEFTVRRNAKGTTVTVVEGRVSINDERTGSQSRAPTTPLLLAAGERVAIGGDSAVQPAVEQVEPANAVAWTARRLVFDDLPLEAVAAEFNRYNVRQIHVQGGLRSRSITGVFDANDPEAFLSFIAGAGDMAVTRSDTGDTVIHPNTPPTTGEGF